MGVAQPWCKRISMHQEEVDTCVEASRHAGALCRGWSTHHDLGAFEQGDLQVVNLHVHSTDECGVLVPQAELLGGTYNEVGFPVVDHTGLGEHICAGAHKVVQGPIEGLVVGVSRDRAESKVWRSGGRTQQASGHGSGPWHSPLSPTSAHFVRGSHTGHSHSCRPETKCKVSGSKGVFRDLSTRTYICSLVCTICPHSAGPKKEEMSPALTTMGWS